ncbi:MAG: EAL domain-containing protein, partial [Candidatus Methylopumilus sp.]
VQPNFDKSATLYYIEKLGLNPRNIIIELTESAPSLDFKLIYRAAEHYRNMGFKIAMDDLGEGFSSLRLWSELQPDYVKIDKHFIRGINTDQVKLEFVRSIQQIAQSSGACVIAEGIETEAELLVIKDLKIAYGQGYLLGRPAPKMLAQLPEEIKVLLNINTVRVYQAAAINAQNRSNVSKLIKYVPTVSPNATNEDVYHLFQNNSNLYSLPVVDQGRPVGLISRYSMIDGFARPYQLELMANAYALPLWISNH